MLSSAAPVQQRRCATPRRPPGLFTGKIVACQRGVNARVEKGFNVLQGGAAGMILYNPTLADVETDNHWLPTVHLADGTDVRWPSWPPTPASTAQLHRRRQGRRARATSWPRSPRAGPAGNFIKPDVTAPGVQILAGHTPTPGGRPSSGPPGEYFQAIAGHVDVVAARRRRGASCSSALHPTWTPGPGQVGADDHRDHRRASRRT